MEEIDTRQRFYDRYVSTFNETNAGAAVDDSESFRRWADARYLPHFAQHHVDAAILELGCGHGRMLRYLKSRGYKNVSGIDISSEQVLLAQNAGLNAAAEDVFDHLRAHPSSYDVIIAIDLVEHFRRDELLDLFSLMRDSLRERGTVLIQTANGEGLFPGHIIYGDLTHQTIFNPSSMEQLMRLTAFANIRFAETAPLSNGLKGTVRSLLWSWLRFSLNFWRKIEAGKTQAIWTENMIVSATKLTSQAT